MLLMRTFSSADTSAVDCLSETLRSACTTSAVSVVVVSSLRVRASSCHALVTRIRRMRARSGQTAARAGGAPTSPSAAATLAASAAASEGVSWPLLGFHEDEEACCSDIWESKACDGWAVEVTLSTVAGPPNPPKAKAPSCTAVVSLSFSDNSVRSARRTLHGGEVVLRKEARE